MKKLKLSLANAKAAQILSREQLKEITGGDGSGSLGPSCITTADCPAPMICCPTTDGSDSKRCVYAAPSGGCPTSGVSGCYTKCSGNPNVFCSYNSQAHECQCTVGGGCS